MSWDERCQWVQVHTADHPAGAPPGLHRVGLAVEPMTCAPAALNDGLDAGRGLISIEPSATAEAAWTIGVIVGPDE